MKGKIDSSGTLQIERAGCYVYQNCPYNRDFLCGHICPLFGEPHDKYTDNFGRVGAMMTICQERTLRFDEFTDERGTP